MSQSCGLEQPAACVGSHGWQTLLKVEWCWRSRRGEAEPQGCGGQMVRPCLILSEIVQYADGCLVGDQPELQSPTAVLRRTPPRDRYQCRADVKSRPCGRSLSLSLLQPVAPAPWSWVDRTLNEPQEEISLLCLAKMWTRLIASQSLTSRLSTAVIRLHPRDASLAQ